MATGEQLEFYFSRQNLQTDGFLVSQMNAQMCVPVSVIAQFHKIQQLTSDPALIVESVKDSAVCVVTPDGLKPTIKQERNTIILREIPSETPQEKVRGGEGRWVWVLVGLRVGFDFEFWRVLSLGFGVLGVFVFVFHVFFYFTSKWKGRLPAVSYRSI